MSTSVYDVLYQWARRTSSWGAPDAHPSSGLIYRLKHWPDLPPSIRIAPVYRALSVMSHRPVNRHWLLSQSHLDEAAVDSLLKHLGAQGALEVTDAANYPQDLR